jgi:RHS repeat-associated protein
MRRLGSSVGSLILGAALAAAVPAAADVHPNDASGFQLDQVFQSGTIDNINLFNGSLTVVVPLGQRYHVGANLYYQVSLVYNSNPWSFWQRFDQNYNTEFNEADPSYCSNAGLGWHISFGRIFTPCVPANQDSQGLVVFEAPDGSQHIFYATLHSGDPDDPGDTPTNQNVMYTRDGTYLRLSKESTGTWLMEFPDGSLNRFTSAGMLMQIIDRFNNQVSIDYSTANQWNITDTQGRHHTIYFRTDLLPYTQTVDHVVLAAFGGATATYQFSYYPAVSLYKGCPFNDPAAAGYTTNQTSAPLLAGFTQPDGSAYTIPQAAYNTSAPLANEICTENSGSLLSLTLPTLGQMQWTYMPYSFPVSNSRPWRTTNYGVATRTLLNAQGGVVGTWTYATALNLLPNQTNQFDLVNTVSDPLGNRVERHFSVGIFDSFTEPSVYNYGSPFSVAATAPGSSTLYLSSRTYDAGNHLLRSDYVTFEHDQIGSVVSLPDASNDNRRMLASRTVYEDDGESYTETDSSAFDGLGHYRWVRQTGTFAGSADHIVGLNYNPGVGVYDIVQTTNQPAADNTFHIPLPSTPWVLENPAWKQVTEGASTSFREFCFSAANGFVYRTRILSANGTTESPNDLLILDNPDADGNLASEQSYGGDLAGDTLPSGPTCLLGGTGEPALPPVQYQVNNTYQYGSLATSQYSGASFLSTNDTIDANTGLAATSHDPAGVATSRQYDAMGRLFYVRPAQSAYTQYSYARATGPGALAKVTVQQQQNGVPSNVETQHVLWFDDFGQLIREDQTMPSGATSSRFTSYNALGWKTSVTEMGSSTATQFQSFDPFGRPGLVVPPDGTGHEVTLTYHGIRQADRTVRIGQAWNGSSVNEGFATTSEVYDRIGRLYQVIEPPGGLTATYAYDAGNRLTQATLTGGSTTQSHSFHYDMRGFLQTETHSDQSGTVSYFGYDARGHYTRKNDGVNDLSYAYDAAERPTVVYFTGTSPVCTAGGTNCVKTFTYATANTSGSSNGKLVQAQRYNFPVLNGTRNVELLQTSYVYSGLDGRLSQRDLRLIPNGDMTANAHEWFTQSWTYNDLGDVAGETYPGCAPQFAGCTGTTPRTVNYTYTFGRLTAVVNYTGTVPGQAAGTGITYLSNGMVSQVAHSNGVVWTETADPSGLARPATITVTAPGGGALWSTGSYQYDGTGNVKQIGGSYYLYDNVSRLTAANNLPSTALSGGSQFQSFTYDNFGNLQGYTGTIGLSTPTSSQTNQLTGGTYDAAGNLRSWNGAIYDFDALNQLGHYKNGAQEWLYMYDADDERVWQFQVGVSPRFDRWTLRGLDSKVRRTFEVTAWGWGNWSSGNFWEDMLYRGNAPLEGVYSSGTQRHMDVDHLGTVRLTTNLGGAVTAYHAYYPFGEELTAFNQDTERIKIAGQERDLASLTSDQDDLDYLHSRFMNPLTGRFLSLDLLAGNTRIPQSWNRFAFVRNNPLKYVDPTGLDPCLTDDCITVIAQAPTDTADILAAASAQLSALLSNLANGFGYLDVSTARSYYLSRFDQAAANGQNFRAFLYYSTNWLFVPDSQADLGVQLGLALLPGGDEILGAAKGLGDVFAGYLTEKGALEAAEKWLGPGYKEIADGVFRSADDARQFRMTGSDLGAVDPHVHFESIGLDGRSIVENGHAYLVPEP